MCMIGFVDENANPIGELGYQAMIRQEGSRKEFKEICRHIARTEEPALRTVTTCTSNVQLAKKILAVTMAADILPKAYGQVVGDSFFDFSVEFIKMEMVFVFRLVVLFYFIWLLGDEANTFVNIGKYFTGMFLVYDIGVVLLYFMIEYITEIMQLFMNGLIESVFEFMACIVVFVKYNVVAFHVTVSRGLGVVEPNTAPRVNSPIQATQRLNELGLQLNYSFCNLEQLARGTQVVVEHCL